MKVGDKFLCSEDHSTMEIVDKHFSPLHGEIIYDLRFSITDTTIRGIVRKTIIDLLNEGLISPYTGIEPVKYVKRLELHP